MSKLIPDETREQVGGLLDEPIRVTIHASDAQRFALALGDRNPIYFDEAAARAAGYRTLVVPPTLLSWAMTPPLAPEDLRTDGLPRDRGKPVPLNVERAMAGGETWELLAPIYAGDEITAETRLQSLEEKHGRSGPMVLQIRETTFTNQDGEVVARQQGKGIAR